MLYIFILLYLTQGESKYFASLDHVIVKQETSLILIFQIQQQQKGRIMTAQFDPPGKFLNVDQGHVHHK